jgi:hypothetical protein
MKSIPIPTPRNNKGPIIKIPRDMTPPKKPIKGGKLDKPFPMPGIDDKIVRTMPITQKQLGQIKKMYKLK